MSLQVGDIAFSYPKKLGFYSRAVRWFTNSKWSHCFYVAPPYMGELMVIETDLKIQVVPFHKEYVVKNADAFEVYTPSMASMDDRYLACSKAFKETAGQTYGFLSILWFALKMLFRAGWKDNFFTDGVICSELLLIYLKNLGGPYADAFSHLTVNETSPQDIYEVVVFRPDLFQKVGLDA